MQRLKVSEIFESIQGEGPNMGRRALFIRLHGCNLNCSTCDTKYARDGNYRFVEVEEIADLAENFDYIVITGGEPLLQRDIIHQLIKQHFSGQRIDVETNGTIDPLPPLFGVRYIVSPKKNSLLNTSFFTRDDVIFKFVVGNSEWAWKENELRKILPKIKQDVYLMPESRTKEELEKNSPYVCDLAIKLGVNYSDRLQIRVGGR